MAHLLSVSNLNVRFDRDVLKNVSFGLAKGEVLAVIGPNGAGKSVLLRALLGLVEYSGSIAWESNVRTSYVPQRLSIDHDFPLSVLEFLHFKKAARSTITNVLASAGITDSKILHQPLGTLSGGQLQRVIIAWSLLDNPDVLLYDEPTTGIDAGGEEAIYTLLKQLQDERGIAVVLVSHDLNMVYRYATRVICINRHMVCFGPPNDVLDSAALAHLYGRDVGLYEHRHQHTHP